MGTRRATHITGPPGVSFGVTGFNRCYHLMKAG